MSLSTVPETSSTKRRDCLTWAITVYFLAGTTSEYFSTLTSLRVISQYLRLVTSHLTASVCKVRARPASTSERSPVWRLRVTDFLMRCQFLIRFENSSSRLSVGGGVVAAEAIWVLAAGFSPPAPPSPAGAPPPSVEP